MKEMFSRIKELLDRNEIDVLIAWRYDPSILDMRPALFKKDDDLNALVFDERCVHNLTSYLPALTDRYRKVGIILKGCDGRALVTLLAENQVNRDKVFAIAIACKGVVVNGKQAEKCADCATSISPVADLIFGEADKKKAPEFARVREIERMTLKERWNFFSEYLAKCTRCYACRQVCPLCYCEVCVVDKQEPRWIEPSAKISANTMWHLVRAYHLAGRCADCGECERVCPQGIPIRLLNNAMEKVVIDMFKVRPGMIPDQPMPLVMFDDSDHQIATEQHNG